MGGPRGVADRLVGYRVKRAAAESEGLSFFLTRSIWYGRTGKRPLAEWELGAARAAAPGTLQRRRENRDVEREEAPGALRARQGSASGSLARKLKPIW